MLTLVNNGTVNLSDPIGNHLTKMPAAWKPITVGQFLTHSSGIPQPEGDRETDFWAEVARLAKKSLQNPPTQQYNNFNFAVMGELVRLKGKPTYMGYMQKHVFQPLQMASTGLPVQSTDVATGYLKGANGIKPVTNVGWLTGPPNAFGIASGGLQSTLADIIKFCKGLPTVLSGKALASIFKPYDPKNKITNTAGWQTRKYGDKLLVYKDGFGTGIGTRNLVTLIGQTSAVIILTNLDSDDVNLKKLTDEMVDYFKLE